MSLILKWLAGSVGPWLVGAVLVAIIGGFASCTVERADLKTTETELSQAKKDLKQTVDANAANQKVVESLQKELDKWKTSAEKAAHADDDLVKSTQAQAKELSQKDQQLQAQQEAIDRALPNCQKLLTMDIAAACPGHAALDRLRAADRLSGPRNKGTNPSHPAP